MSAYEPTDGEIRLTLLMGWLAAPFYRNYVNSLPLSGRERVLDFGSGSGVCSRFLAHRLAKGGGKLACVDVSRRWQTVIRKTLKNFDNVEYRCAEIDDLDYPAGWFDAAFIHFTLHDIPEDETGGVLAALGRLLKPGARVYVREPAHPEHGILPGRLQGLMEAGGFETISLRVESSWLTGDLGVGVFANRGGRMVSSGDASTPGSTAG